jgi:succinate dehydrogenase/fumarate reductase flavoprotein subunit
MTAVSKKNLEPETERALSRRSFLAGALSVGTVSALGALGACAPSSNSSTADNSTGDDSKTGAAGKENNAAASDWIGTEPEIDTAAVSETIETEVLVVGGGTGGLFACCSAAENGARVLVIDKFTSGGIRNDIGAINSRYQQEAGVDIDVQEIVREAYRYSSGRMQPDLHYVWARESGEVVDWYGDRLAERDVQLWLEFTEEKEQVNYKHFVTGHSPAWPMDDTGKMTLDGTAVLTDYATKLGVEFRYNTPMIKLTKSNGRVSGVIAQQADTGDYVQINASKGVIVCTGGYAENHEMVKTLQPETYNLVGFEQIIPGSSGDGIKACIWAGADHDNDHSLMMFDRCALPVGTVPEGPDSGGAFFWLGEQPFLKVNLKGKRFTNESGTYDFIAHAASKQPQRVYCTIWDSNFKDDIVHFDMHGCSRTFPNDNGAQPDIPLEIAAGMVEGLIEQGIIQQADSIEQLAEKLQLPPDAFRATIERYNELYDAGVDEDYGKEPFRLSAIRQAPFFGTWTCAYTLCTLDGIRIDTDMRALDAQGDPIPGLYVVGNDSGGYYANTYFNLATGHACGRTVTFGRHAGRMAATS